MVSSREAVKKRLEEELAKKIGGAEELLKTLRDAAAEVQVNSKAAKEDVNSAYEEMHARLVNRKVELTRQIDLISNSQIDTLQEGFHSTLITLGSLQATLKNLDSFDNTQLFNLHIPDVSLCCNEPVSSAPIEVGFEEGSVQAVSQWGNVTAKGIKGLVDVGNTASMPKRYVDYNDEKVAKDLMSHKPVTGDGASVISFKAPPRIPASLGKRQTTVTPSLQDFSLEDWLLEMKTEACSPSLPDDSDEDFEIVDAAGAKQQEISNLEQDLKQKCIVNNSSEDLSKWLCRSRKRSYSTEFPQPSTSSSAKYSVPYSSCAEEMRNTGINQIDFTSKKTIIEFPCLQLNDTEWIASKKTKRVVEKSSFTMSDFIPPAYALPTPFWLQKKGPKSS